MVAHNALCTADKVILNLRCSFFFPFFPCPHWLWDTSLLPSGSIPGTMNTVYQPRGSGGWKRRKRAET